jgi:hypothetical protein
MDGIDGDEGMCDVTVEVLMLCAQKAGMKVL